MRRRVALFYPIGLWAGNARAADAAAQAPALGVSERRLQFPADFGAHPDTRIEWWYATGALVAAEAPRGAAPTHGFQLTFFRARTGLDAAQPSRFAAHQLVFAHAAVSEVSGGRLRHDERIARAVLGVAGAATGDTRAWIRDWQLAREDTASPPGSRYRARLASDAAGFTLDLALSTTQPLLLQGRAGYSRKGPDPGQASHYYSQPQLAVEGTLVLDGRRRPVRGRAWLDHEWSDTLLHPEAVGWDWIGMNLDDGSALTAFRLRRADGRTLYAGGSWRTAGGPVRAFGADELRFAPGRSWTSPRTRARYPVAWQVDTPLGRFGVEALFDDQELDSRASTGTVYWEGLSRLTDAAGRPVGGGYLEMTGYVERLRL
ncbi:lipocalin-like domain-containing protein [Piscinibacter sakaiensis]|uniref:AttH component of AttEFGH ABC transport system n=1 Tax=Piscinibacter sakaiensis TaxID=1547922 RepID=A0A0K8P6M5_PISS1|nr:carotenoid 1,2-hydratase [Piscinibacter sakaiensis]GAP38267.1 AttH component of AttEFGH ABC transport system [Piscinibacter sakaiensis]